MLGMHRNSTVHDQSHLAVPTHPDAAQLEIERKLRALLTKDKEKAEEEAALAFGLCTGTSMLP